MEVLLEEVESLEAILMDDVKINRNSESGLPELIETTVLPTVGEDFDRQYVCITLQVIPTPGYPDEQPEFHLRNPRGLDDSNIERIKTAIRMKLIESIGAPVVFDLIEVIREHLTQSNLPSGQCVVCLYGFQDGDEFTKTLCYHYLHSYCLARHLMASHRNYEEEQMKLPAWQQKLSKDFQPCCPVCREVITDDVEPLRQSIPPMELQNAPKFELTNELKILQTKMANLLMHQKSRGGIIDIDATETNIISIDSEENRQRDVENGISRSETDSQTKSTIIAAGGRNNHHNNNNNNKQQIESVKPKVVVVKNPIVKNDEDESDKEDDQQQQRHRRRGGHHDHHHGKRSGNRHNRLRKYYSGNGGSSSSSAGGSSAGGGGGGGSSSSSSSTVNNTNNTNYNSNISSGSTNQR